MDTQMPRFDRLWAAWAHLNDRAGGKPLFLLNSLPWGPVEKHWPHSDWRQGAAGQQEAPPRGDFKERGVVMKRRKTGGLHATQTLHTRAAGGRMRSKNAGRGFEASPIPSSQCTVLNSQAWKGQGLPPRSWF